MKLVKLAPHVAERRYCIKLLILLLILLMVTSNLLAEKEPVKQAAVETVVTIKITIEEMPIRDIHHGDFSETIKDPHCIDIKTLIRNTPQFREMKENKTDKGGDAKHWILLANACETAYKWVDEFALAKKIPFICERKNLWLQLRKQAEFKDLPEKDLIARFDLTQAILDFKRDQAKNTKATKPPFSKK